VIRGLAPFQKKYNEIKNNPEYIEKVINDGAKKAKALAEPMIKNVRKKIGLD